MAAEADPEPLPKMNENQVVLDEQSQAVMSTVRPTAANRTTGRGGGKAKGKAKDKTNRETRALSDAAATLT